MNSNTIRDAFLQFFESKQHKIVPSAPLVIKNDPTLMFTNAGMNQFKELFLGNSPIEYPRIADSQKCLRVSGKHNDLEEVGYDTYHHTMFEMLGNWSFGNYFKEEAIAWAWEFLVDVMKIDKNKLYVTVFEGSKDDNLEADNEARDFWKRHIDENRIIYGSKKDNFWEMGDTGPCGPCSEIHIDLRDKEEIAKIPGKQLVNTSHPEVIEIWNLVFIQFNRKADKSLELLPDKHVDTGMGFERLCIVLQNKKSAYDTDIFQPVIQKISFLAGIQYGNDPKTDIAFRVIADHLRAVSFAIADGEIPSNTGAGYVIRRILRRAVRYGYTFLNQQKPFICDLVQVLAENMGKAYPELVSQKQLIEKVIKEEETAFLKTLETGIRLLDDIINESTASGKKVIPGDIAFKLYDTYGFPLDLTELIAKENHFSVNREEFQTAMEQQKNRSRNAAAIDTEDWIKVSGAETTEFVGYDTLSCETSIIRYRKIKTKGKELYQLVLDKTPFYAESGGQMGDSGLLKSTEETIRVIDTKKENNLMIHLVEKLPASLKANFTASVDLSSRTNTQNNHSATHLLHFALRKVLGTHVEQKGSLVCADYLRFDFSHFQKVTPEELETIEKMVNEMIRQNVPLNEKRSLPIEEAKKMGAMALFGEKYGNTVRVIQFGDSIELCGGTHVHATGNIGIFKITSESAIAAGIRRIEAISGEKAYQSLKEQESLVNDLKEILKNPKDIKKAVEKLLEENSTFQKQMEVFTRQAVKQIKTELTGKIKTQNGISILAEIIDIDSASMLKDIAFQLKAEKESLFMVLGAVIEGKANLAVMISDNLIKDKGLNAATIIREISKEIDGGGGGQPFFATAGGKKPEGLKRALERGLGFVE